MKIYRQSELLTSNVRRTQNLWELIKGLSGKTSLAKDEALVLSPCHHVDTFFMKFPIDVIFLNRAGGIIALYPNLKPLRMTWIHLQATRAVECAWGTIERWHLKKGEVLRIES